MKKKTLIFIVMVFVLVFTAACGGGNETPAAATEAPAEAPAEAAPNVAEAPAEEPAVATEVPTEAPVEEPAAPAPEFPLPDDASNVMVVGEGVTNFQTALSMPDVMTFYRFAFPDYTERQEVTVFSEEAFNLVFDGHESGKAVVVQGFPISDGVVNVSVRLE